MLYSIVIAISFGIMLFAAGHALLHKRDSRSALGWVALCLSFPLFGAGIYFLLGVNRITNKAIRLQNADAAHSAAQHANDDEATEPQGNATDANNSNNSPDSTGALNITNAATPTPPAQPRAALGKAPHGESSFPPHELPPLPRSKRALQAVKRHIGACFPPPPLYEKDSELPLCASEHIARRLHPRHAAHSAAEQASLESRHIAPAFREIQMVGRLLTKCPLIGGNGVRIFHNGNEAYPRMLDAINSAEKSVYLVSYIFSPRAIGKEFIDALSDAQERGVEVRVLLDGVGEFNHLPRAGSVLKKRGVPVARFLPPQLFPPQISINLRNHRKMLLVDGKQSFTGGMNIDEQHLIDPQKQCAGVQDMHYALVGPVVKQLEDVFWEDWTFTTGEERPEEKANERFCGDTLCRVIKGGPGRDIDTIPTLLMGVISTATRNIRIMSPYFLPPDGLITALQAAALRGVSVEIILPQHSDHFYVDWATRNMLWQLLRFGVHVAYQPAPFAHTKLLLIDDTYAHIGSSNLDPRSLRLNFELNVELFDSTVARELRRHFVDVQSRSQEIFAEQLEQRSLFIRLRDAVCWLFSPYL